MTYIYKLSIGIPYSVIRIEARLIRYKKANVFCKSNYAEQNIFNSLYNFTFGTGLNINYSIPIFALYKYLIQHDI